MNDLKNDIDRYLKGELTPSEMHALEKKALRDPFLADALEGASEINADAFETDIQSLKVLIDKRTNQSKKVIPLWNWTLRIAAGLTLIAVSTFVIINVVKDSKPEQLAENKVKSEPIPSEQKEQAPLLDSIEQAKPSLPISEKSQASKPSAISEPSSAASQPIIAGVEIQAEEEKEITAERAKEKVEVAATPAEVSPPSFAKKQETKDDVAKDSKRKSADAHADYGYTTADLAEKSNTKNIRTIKGHISSFEDGSALPGVNVLIKGTNVGTVTDGEGNYEIALTDTQDELVFSSIGLKSTEINASKLNQLDVQMSSDVSQLSEVVVTGYATRNDVDIDDGTANLELASPLGGRKAYKQYLEKNLRYPEVALTNKIEGKVTIEFTVETTGTLSEFKVLRGLGYGCDEEVIRLVKDGAPWTPSKYGKELVESNVKIRLRFALPKKSK